MPKENMHFRCTLPGFYEEGCLGHTDPSARQGHYITAETAREAARQVFDAAYKDIEAAKPVRIDVQIWRAGHKANGKVVAQVWLEYCPKCNEPSEDVGPRNSYGVYAGIMCRGCCYGFRDHCGIDGGQGSPAELEEMGENYWEEDEVWV